MKNKFLKVYASFILISMTVLAANLGLSHLLKSNVPKNVWNKESGGLNDLHEVKAKINSLKNICPQELIVGSSVSKDLNFGKSMNLSYLGAAMMIQEKVIGMLENSFLNCPQGKTTILLEILPPLYNKQSVKSFSDKNQLKLSYLTTWGEIFQTHSIDSFNLAVLKLRNYMAPEMTLNLLKWKIFGVKTKATSDFGLKIFDNLYDLKNGDLDAGEVIRLRSVVSRLSKLSARLVLYVPPQNQELWHYTQEGQGRIESLLKEIERESKLSIIRADKQPFQSHEFRDPLHLTKEGSLRFQALLKVEANLENF